jgi:zinc/manganese transport system substrate-binding protein
MNFTGYSDAPAGSDKGRGLTLTRRSFLTAIAALAPFRPALAETAPLPVVASFSILGDLVKEVGGAAVDLSTIVGPNGDAHVYEPTPQDGRKLAQARLVFINGLGFEGWIERLIKASGTKARIVTLGDGVTARKDENGLDPHVWQNVENAIKYVEAIGAAFEVADPAHAAIYSANAAAYREKLAALDADIARTFQEIPKERRRIVSTHDAFGYFAARYGLKFIAPQGVSTESEASAREVAKIIDAVKQNRVAAVFLENIADPRLTQRIAAETGAKIGGTLYSDALSEPGGPAPTYIDMMRHNVGELAKALGA